MKICLGVNMGSLWKKLLRDISGAKGQFLAVALVIACGIGSYITISFAFKNLMASRDSYCQQYRFADLFFIIDRAPRSILQKIQAIPGVAAVNGRIVFDIPLDLPHTKEALVGRIISLPDKKVRVLNDVHIVQGEYFSPSQEQGILVNPVFCAKNNLRVGDSIWGTINNRKRKLQIRGTSLSPEYIYAIRTAQDFLPNPQTFAICYAQESFCESAFGYQASVNDIVVSVTDRRNSESIKKEIEEILEPYGLLAKVTRKDQVSYKFISDELRGLEASARIFPTIFLIVAALTIFIMLSRIVANQRMQIGVLKALGYSNWQIIWHYLGYAGLISLLGSGIGCVWGTYMGTTVLDMYRDIYHFPVMENIVYYDVFFITTILSLFYCWLAGVFAVWQVTQISPATAMRPSPPVVGKHIILESWPWIWRRTSFVWKIIFRNMFRHPGRTLFIIVGIGMSTAILIYAFFIMDAMDGLIHHEFASTQLQDIKIFFFDDHEHRVLYELRKIPYVTRVEPVYEYAFEFKNGWRKKIALITAIEPNSFLRPILDTKGNSITIEDEGIVVSEKLSEILDLRVGERLHIKPLQRGKKEKSVVIKKIVPQYLGLSAYMSIKAVSRLLQEGYLINGALLKVESGKLWNVHAELKKRSSIATVIFQESIIQNFEKTIGASMYVMTTIISLFAGIIAFAIIYNSAIISISERQRELATLKVMGFYNQEVTQVVFHEYFLLASIGILIGFPMGLYICEYIASVYDTEIYRLPVYISNSNLIKTTLQIFFYVLISQWACRYRLKKLDMVEVLKIRE